MDSKWVKRFSQEKNILTIYLLSVAFIFSASYLKYWVNGLESPSWIYWFDQSKYYESVLALLKLDFSSSSHFYPLGYQLAALIPVFFLKQHGYGLLNLFLCLITFYFIYKICRIYLNTIISALISLLLFRYDSQITFELVTPWTNNIVLTLYSIIAFLFLQKKINIYIALYFGLLFGGILFSRPSDIIYLIPIYISILIIFIINKKYYYATTLSVTCFLASTLFVLFQYLIYGGLMSPYMEIAKGFTFSLSGLDQKIFSLFFSGEEAFLTDDPMLFKRFPWLVIYPASIIYFYRQKEYIMLIVQLSTLLGFLFAVSFAPMMPPTLRIFEGMRMLAPFIIFMGLASLIYFFKIIEGFHYQNLLSPCLCLLIVIIINLNIFGIGQKAIDHNYHETIVNGSRYIEIESKNNFIYKQIYLKGLLTDDLSAAQSDRTIRIEDQLGCFKSQQTHLGLSRSWGVAIPLISKRETNKINISIDKSLKIDPKVLIFPMIGNTEFCFFCENKLRNNIFIENYDVNNELDDFKYVFYGESSINSNVAKKGWSVKEITHTWSIGSYSEILLPKAEILDNHISRVNVSSFGDQNIIVFLNGKVVDKFYINGNGEFKDINILLPKDILHYDKQNLLKFEYSNAKSPKSLGINSDQRKLALAIREIQIRAESTNKTVSTRINEGFTNVAKNTLTQQHSSSHTGTIRWSKIHKTEDEIKIPINDNSDSVILYVTNKTENRSAKIAINDKSGLIEEIQFNCFGDSVRSIKLRKGMRDKFIYIKNFNEESLIINKIGVRNK